MYIIVFIYVLNVGLGGGVKIDIKKYVCGIFLFVLLQEFYLFYLYIFFLIILEKDFIDKKKKVVVNNIFCFVRYIYFMMFLNVKFFNLKGMKWLIFIFLKNWNGFWRK